MRMILCVLCVAMCSGIASAQQYLSNFDACVGEAKQRHTDSAMDTYTSFKCDGNTAQRLAARPDECAGDVKPSLSRMERRSRQLADGLYMRMIWRTGVCAGMCEVRFYNDSRDTSYLCEVRRHIDRPARVNGPVARSRRYANEYPRGWRWEYRSVTDYDQPDFYERRRMPENDEGAGRMEGWRHGEPEWYQEYRYPGDYPDDYRRNDYRPDDSRRDVYRQDDYYGRDDYRQDGYRRDYYRGDDYRRAYP